MVRDERDFSSEARLMRDRFRADVEYGWRRVFYGGGALDSERDRFCGSLAIAGIGYWSSGEKRTIREAVEEAFDNATRHVG